VLLLLRIGPAAFDFFQLVFDALAGFQIGGLEGFGAFEIA